MIVPFVDQPWLEAHRGQTKLADVRFYLDGRSGRAAYEQGHLPGAVYVGLEGILSAPAGPEAAAGRHPLPAPADFAAGLTAAGIGDEDTVVAYDDQGGVIAARLVWLLRAIGHDAALLDGGLTAWDGPLETGPGNPAAKSAKSAEFTPVPWPPGRLATKDEVAATTATVIDARDATRFNGGPDPVDPRSGHIPGARSVPARENVDDRGRIASREHLRQRFGQAGITGQTEVISYCGSGVTACHNLLALEHAGLGRGRLYPGSWSEWSRDPSRPVEVDR